jgi:CubicO group peptidase (beta-lactamase class C family)
MVMNGKVVAHGGSVTRRRWRGTGAVLVAGLLAFSACSHDGSGAAPTTSASQSSTTSTASTPGATASKPEATASQAEAIAKLVTDTMASAHLRAVIVRATVNGKEVLTQAFGESMTGVPASTSMHFRNGAVAISYMSTLLLQLVDEQKVSLTDKVSKWLPSLPHADEVTLGQLAQMTSGYADYALGNEAFANKLQSDPFQHWTQDELLDFADVDGPLRYQPGTNWNYAHTNYVILGLALEKITGMPLDRVLQDKVLGPLGLTNTANQDTPFIPEPALHAFSSERRSFLKIPDGTPFYEESTYWNSSWFVRGALETTNIADLHKTAIAIGTGELLSQDSYRKMISTDLRGTGSAISGCATCGPQTEQYAYGLGIVTTGDWVMQNPLFSGESAAFAYLPSQNVAIAVAVTYEEGAFASDGNYSNEADALWRQIGALLAPDNQPPAPK